MGTTFDASKWSIHRLISSDLSVLLHGMSFTHRRYCSAWLQFSFRDRIGSRGCDCPINGWSDGLIHCVGISAILFITWRCISICSRLPALSSLFPLTCTGLCRLFRSLLWLWLLPLLCVLWLLRLSLSLFLLPLRSLRSLLVLDRYRTVVLLWGPLLQRLAYSTDLGSHGGPLSSSAPHRSRSELAKVPLAWL